MAMLTGSSQALQADPNVTPLIDVLLVLLIIFMVIVPVTPRGLSALLPQRPTSAQADPEAPIVVEVLVSKSGPVYLVNGQEVGGQSVPQNPPGRDASEHATANSTGSGSARALLVATLQRVYAERANKVLFVKGDPGLSFASVAEVIDAGRAAGADHVAILTPGAAARQNLSFLP